MNKEIIVIGGGLGGLIVSILLQKRGFEVLLIEKKEYPFHRVCGEYISKEVIPFLKKHDLYPEQFVPASLDKFRLTSTNGKSADLDLKLGGFGISRFELDKYLAEKALNLGVLIEYSRVDNITYTDNQFEVLKDDGDIYKSKIVIGSFGKRSNIDKRLKRDFINKRSPYLGVKYHIKYKSQENNVVALHNFQNGYCGINKIEGDKFNLCYLSESSNLKKTGSIQKMEEQILCKNPHLAHIFEHAEFLFDKPKVINEISFETKKPIENHILMCGDAAGMITPLCGNGMAMAIRSAYLLANCVNDHYKNGQLDRPSLESHYTQLWNNEFRLRLKAGRTIQNLFGSEWTSNVAVFITQNLKGVASYLVSQTHGKPFQ